jgi:hypothetical protein
VKIDYIVLHWNRPYFAEINVKLAKLYFPFIRNFILLDDGSEPNCIEILKKEFTEVITSKNNKNEWKNGSVGYLLENFFTQSDADFIIFTEDDFLPCLNYFDDSETENTLISPDVLFKQCVVAENLETHIHNIGSPFFYLNLGKSNYGWKSLDAYEYNDNFLRVIPHKEKRIYSNWPWIMGKNVFKKAMKNLKDAPIWQIENIIDGNMKKISRVKPLCVKQKMFIHAGFICTTRKDAFSQIGKFNKNRLTSASNFTGESQTSLDALRSEYLSKYFSGKRISMEDLFTKGLHHALKNFITS